MKSAIINFFEFMSTFTGHKLNGAESIPILYWGDTYVTGFKVDENKNIMVHFKIIKHVNLNDNLQGLRSDYYMMNPDGDFWLPYEFLDESTIDEVFKEMSEKVMALKNFNLLSMEHTDKFTDKKVKEGIIFTSKRLACKEAMNYRKTYTDFSMRFLEIGEKPKREKQISAFEFATSALE